MQITGISIRNFRCFGNETQSLKARAGLNVLVGENNNGKSTVSAALEHGLTFAGLQWNDAPWGSTINPCELSISILLGDDAQRIVAEFTASPSPRTSELAGILEKTPVVLHVRSTSKEVLWRVTVGDIDLTQRGKRAPVNKHWKDFAGGLAHDAPLLVSLRDAKENITFPADPGQVIANNLRTRIRRFADVRSRPVGSAELNVQESFDGRATATLLFNLKNGNATERKRYERLQQRFAQFFPSYGFECNRDESSNSRIVILRDDREFDIPPNQAGTGLFEILTLIANLENRERHILIVEEPGAHLHPQAQRALQRLILESAQKNQLFVITHSPEFVNWASLDGLARVWLKGPDSQISPISEDVLSNKDRAVLVESLRDPRRREVLFARGVALVEGETEEAYLEALAPRLNIDLDALGVSVISVGGEGNYGPYLKYLKALSIPCKCQRDKYPQGIADEWKPLFTYTDSEFEEYMKVSGHGPLLDEAKAKVGKSKARVGRYCGEKIEPDKVPPKHREFLDVIAKLPQR